MKEIDDILEIMETDARLTDEQLEQLDSDTELRTAAEDIVLAQHVLSPKPDKAEVDARLKAFKTRMREKVEAEAQQGPHARMLWFSLTAVAAVIAGLIWILQKPGQMDDPSLLIEADAVVGAHITDMEGNEIPLTAQRKEGADAVISPKDYATDIDILDRDTLLLSLSQGQSYRVDLPDGSKVYLHPGSKLLYPTRFGRQERNVRLEGEGYFIVAKDASRPFRVFTGRSVTSVLGTEFNLSSRGESDESLVLVNGLVSYKNITAVNPVQIRPGQEAVLNQHGFIDIHTADTMQYTSWRDGFIYYDRSSLNDILKQIGRTYNVSVHCYNRELLDLHMHFVLRRDDSIDDAVRTLNSMKKVHATLKGNTLIVR